MRHETAESCWCVVKVPQRLKLADTSLKSGASGGEGREPLPESMDNVGRPSGEGLTLRPKAVNAIVGAVGRFWMLSRGLPPVRTYLLQSTRFSATGSQGAVRGEQSPRAKRSVNVAPSRDAESREGAGVTSEIASE